MTSTHGEALGWPRRPVRNTWDDPRWSSVFEGRSHLGWPHDASGLRVEASREVTSAAAGDRDVSRKTEGVALAATGDRDVSRETEQDEKVPVSRETSAGLNGSSGIAPRTATRRVADVQRGNGGSSPGSAPDTQVRSTSVIRGQREPAWSGTRVMTVANQKGGVGKTTTAVNIAAAMAGAGLRVLVVDMDPQGNASTALSIPHASGTMGVYDVLIDGVPLGDVVVESPHVPGLFGAPATIDLAGAEIELVPLVARENRLRRALNTFLDTRPDGEGFDLVLIDCPPSLGLLTVNSFVAADEVLIPIQCEYYALEGLSQLVKNVELIQQHLNAGLRISTILLTMYDARTRLSAEVADQVREHFGDRVLRAAIPRSVRISEAPSHGETVITYDPTSTGALSYVEAAAQMRQQEVSV